MQHERQYLEICHLDFDANKWKYAYVSICVCVCVYVCVRACVY